MAKNVAKRSTLSTIAEELGVTTMTVSKSLRGIGRISKETRERVLRKAEEVGYLSSRERLFPPLVRGSYHTERRLRLLCPSVELTHRYESESYYSGMVSGLRTEMESQGGSVVEESFKDIEALLEYIRSERLHGVVLHEPFPTSWIRKIREHVNVFYTIGFDFETGVDSIYFNEFRAATTIVEELQRAGHQMIGWLGILDRHAYSMIDDREFDYTDIHDQLAHIKLGTRFASWLYLVEQRGGRPRWPIALVDRDWRKCSLSEAVSQGCEKLLKKKVRPSVIICPGPAISFELIKQLRQLGLGVPDDICVVSYGIEEAGLTAEGLSLSGIAMPQDKIGSLLPEIVQRRLAYSNGLALSIQLDGEWRKGQTLKGRI